ncbi:MAG: 9-O-acetylesterase [Bacteroidales bacterium]|nr:9-O-acetylesterase [Candidatus Sodaliphilus aphodohippi]
MRKNLLTLAVCALALGAQAKVTLPAYMTSNMVVQQQSKLIVKGNATNHGTVTVTAGWTKRPYNGPTDNAGNFRIEIPTPKGSTRAYTLTVSDGEPLTLTNVVIGEVWLCSGQSNMDMPINGWGKVMNYQEELKNANYPFIRLLKSKYVKSYSPTDKQQLVRDGWCVCDSASVDQFSAAAYFFARHLWKQLNVPIGVYHAAWGGTPAEAWTSIGTLKNVLDMSQSATQVEACNGDAKLLTNLYEKEYDQWAANVNKADQGLRDHKPLWACQEQTGSEWKTMNLPSAWEDRGLIEFDGIVWFQKVVTIPEKWVGKQLTLNIGKVDDEEATYFNGTKVGECDNWEAVRTYTIKPELVKDRKAIITVRAIDYGGDGGLWGPADSLSLQMGNEQISLAGDWNYRIGLGFDKFEPEPLQPNHPYYMSHLYNSMIYPVRDFVFKGAIWYQGEANVARWEQYTPLFQAMIQDWRQLFKSDLPFYFVQLSSWLPRKDVQPESEWAHLREAQANALQLANTGMACTIDIGDTYDIHPKNKQEVGLRLAKAALAQTYGKGEYELPTYQSMKVDGNKAVLTFNQALTVDGDNAQGFVIAGPDMQFHVAQATVQGNTVTVWSPEVKMPVAVRYAWADNPACNLRGKDNLPLSTFRTDSFE